MNPDAETFLRNVEAWRPAPDLAARLRGRLCGNGVPLEEARAAADALTRCAEASFAYLDFVHDLAFRRQTDRRNFLAHLARLAETVQELRQGGEALEAAFGRLTAALSPGFTRDRFDTAYFDLIQNADFRGFLRDLLQEVDLLLESFSLVSAELSGMRCVEAYEDCLRVQLYLRYLLNLEERGLEEVWSVLFDLTRLLSPESEGPGEAGDLLGRLEAFRLELEEIKRKSRN